MKNPKVLYRAALKTLEYLENGGLFKALYRIKAVNAENETASGVVICTGRLSKKRKGFGRIEEIYFPFGPKAQIISEGANARNGFYYGDRNCYIHAYD